MTGDSLHKAGPGTLRIRGTGDNPGELSAGDGTVVLDQQPDASGRRQAFSVIDIVSGRPTLILTSADQINPETLNFGFRGGRLDLSGHDITFHRINAVDDGARIVSHSGSQVTVAVTGMSWSQWLAGNGGYKTWSYSKTGTPGNLYVYDNPWSHRREYFQLKTARYSYFPTDGTSNDNWTFLGTTAPDALDRQRFADAARSTVFPGRFGEDDPQQPNQGMNVAWRPESTGAVLAVTGGTVLNGSLNVSGGVLLLSGYPVLHANNVTLPEDWRVSAFRATGTDVAPGSTFQVGEYATFDTYGITAWGGSHVVFGYNDSPDAAERLWRCTLDDGNGASTCSQPQRSAQELALLPRSRVSASVVLAQDAQLSVGQALWSGRLASYPTAVTTLWPGAVWQVTGDSHAGLLRAKPESTVDLAVATQGRWVPKVLSVHELEATGLTVGLGADPATLRADRLDVADRATGGGNILQVSFLSALPGNISPGGSLILATAPAGTAADYFRLIPVTQGFTLWRADLRSQESGGRRSWAVAPVRPATRTLMLRTLRMVLPAQTTGTDGGAVQLPAGYAFTAGSPAPPPASAGLPATSGEPAASQDGTVTAFAPSLPLTWFTPEENSQLTQATRRQLALRESVSNRLAEVDARRPLDLMLSGAPSGVWTTLDGGRTAGGGRKGTLTTLALGADTGEGGLRYGVSASLVQARSDRDGTLPARAKAGSAGAWVSVQADSGMFADAGLQIQRLNQTFSPDPSLATGPGEMNITGVTGRLRTGYRWQSPDGLTTIAPWAGAWGGVSGGARLTGQDAAVSQQSGNTLWYGAGAEVRHQWRPALAMTAGVSSLWRGTAPGVTLEDNAAVRRYGALSDRQRSVHLGLEGELSAGVNARLSVARRDEGTVRETTALAGLQWSF